MDNSTVYRQSIDPHYSQADVFERSQGYYTQNLTGLRRMNNSSVGSHRSHHGAILSGVHPSQEIIYNSRASGLQGKQLQEYQQAAQLNAQLNQELNHLMGDSSDFGTSDNVVKLQYYAGWQHEGEKLREQEAEIKKLEETVAKNQGKIQHLRKAGQELAVRMGNIQAIDREIYKNLEGAVNRDRQLLDRAASALARGEKREEVAAILQQIIG